MDVLVTMEKKPNMLLLDFTLQGEVLVTCDRCLDDLGLQLEGYSELIVKLGDHAEEESEDVIVIPSTEHRLDVSHLIYEYTSVMIPMRNVHPDDENGVSTCNPEILREIEKRQPSDAVSDSDPRWEMLKNINLN